MGTRDYQVRQRYATDCGIAALATAAHISYEYASECLFGARHVIHRGDPTLAYWGVDKELMCDTVGELTPEGRPAMPSGVPLIQAHGARGVVLVTRGCDDPWQDGTGKHWLAFWRESNGRITCYNPSNGDTFDAQNLHLHGYRMVCHISVGG